jgi:ribosomal protein S1
VKGTVESYSAHGAYVRIGDVLGYLPLRSMATPPPRSAREYVKIGQGVSLVVSSFTASRRSIDVAMTGVLPVEKKSAPAKAPRAKKKKKRAPAPPARKAPARKK